MLLVWMTTAITIVKKTCHNIADKLVHLPLISFLFFNIMIAALYLLTGYLGLFFAIPPGYATPIWIPSGIALGVVIRFGLRALPGIFFGSLITNYLITLRFGVIAPMYSPLMIGFFIGCGATLQAYCGWLAIKKWIGLNNPLSKPNDILLFAFLSGPLSCLVNATWSNTILWFLQVMPTNRYLLSWITWWLGDCIGVLIFTPMILILFSQSKKIWRQRMVFIFLPLSLAFISASLVWQITVTAFSSYVNQFFWHLWFLLVTSLLFCVLINIILFIIYGQKMLAQDETDKKSNALKKAESQNLLILRSAGEGIYGLDEEGCVTFINPAGERMLGFEQKELLGKSMHELSHHSYFDGKKYPKEKCPIYDSFRLNQVFRVTNEVFWRKDNSYFWVEYTSSPIKNGNHTGGAVVIFNDVTQRRMFENELERMAYYDLLTTLPNRAGFLRHLTQAIMRAQSGNRILAVCFMDIDNFKQINDNLGHTIGDEVLVILAKIIKLELHKEDFFARLGGDEFAIILEGIQSEEDIKPTLNRIINTAKKSINIVDMEIYASISIGIAIYPQAGFETEELVKNADIAMYHAKESGKGSYAFFDEESNKKIKRRHQIDTMMRHAIERNEFSLDYQLQVDTKTLEPIGCEVLLRWHNSEFGHLPPHEFIMIAESNRLIHHIGAWVLRKACSDYSKLLNVFRKKFILSINVSVIQLENIKFIKQLKNILEETNINGECILLEVTETALMNNVVHTIDIMSQIRKLGVQFALDDFGVSYSSMQYLKNLPISFLKIDQSFVSDININKSDAEIVNAIIQLAHGVDLHVIAEGVETEAQLKLLKAMGCEYVQGYYFSKPLTINELLKHALMKNMS